MLFGKVVWFQHMGPTDELYLFTKSSIAAWLLHQIVGMTPPVARDSSEAARVIN